MVSAVAMITFWFILESLARIAKSTTKTPRIAENTAVSAIICTAAGLSVVYFGMLFKNWLVILIGWFEVVFAVLFGLEDVIVFVFSSTWLGLALVGGFSIIFAALLDRYGPLIKLSISKWAKFVAISKSENTRGGTSLV